MRQDKLTSHKALYAGCLFLDKTKSLLGPKNHKRVGMLKQKQNAVICRQTVFTVWIWIWICTRTVCLYMTLWRIREGWQVNKGPYFGHFARKGEASFILFYLYFT